MYFYLGSQQTRLRIPTPARAISKLSAELQLEGEGEEIPCPPASLLSLCWNLALPFSPDPQLGTVSTIAKRTAASRFLLQDLPPRMNDRLSDKHRAVYVGSPEAKSQP